MPSVVAVILPAYEHDEYDGARPTLSRRAARPRAHWQVLCTLI